MGGLGGRVQNGYLPPKISHIRWVKPNGPTNSLITQKVVEQFSKSGHFWKIEIKTHRKNPPPPSPPPLRGLLDSVQNACFSILSVDIWTLSSSPLNGGGGGGGGGFSMRFDLNFSKKSTFWKLLHNFLSYKGKSERLYNHQLLGLLRRPRRRSDKIVKRLFRCRMIYIFQKGLVCPDRFSSSCLIDF